MVLRCHSVTGPGTHSVRRHPDTKPSVTKTFSQCATQHNTARSVISGSGSGSAVFSPVPGALPCLKSHRYTQALPPDTSTPSSLADIVFTMLRCWDLQNSSSRPRPPLHHTTGDSISHGFEEKYSTTVQGSTHAFSYTGARICQ